MLSIGKIYCANEAGQARICADLTLNQKGTTLWFGVEESQKQFLCAERSDAFVMALLPSAMRSGNDITFQTPMSERLHYQLTQYLIPTVCDAGDLYHPIKLIGPVTAEKIANLGGVGTGFSAGVDCLYSIMTHGKDSPLPLTHIAVFNVGAFDGSEYRKNFQNACADATGYAVEQDLGLVCLDSNAYEVIPEEFLEVCSYRNLAGALALQGLFSCYLLSSGIAFQKFHFTLRNGASYDLLMVHCAQTESLAVYSSGGQAPRHEKLKALSEWEPAYNWLHPCFRNRLSKGNCGKCKKCIHTMTELYAYGTLSRFGAVFDVEDYLKHLSENLGYLLTIQDQPLYQNALLLLKEHNIPIPEEAYEEAEKLRNRSKVALRTQTEQNDALRALAQKLRKQNKS